MWQYVYNDELYHYGIKGMKWGHRKARPEVVTSSARGALKTAKSDYRQARKAYSKAYNKAYGYSSMHPISQYTGKKAKAESNRRWNDAINKADKVVESRSAYKQAKKDYKQSDEYKAKRAKAIKVGAAVAGTALAAYGGYKVSKLAKNKYANILADRFYDGDNRDRFVRETAKNVTLGESVVGISRNASRNRAAAKYAKNRAKEEAKKKLEEAQMEYINRNISRGKAHRAYY